MNQPYTEIPDIHARELVRVFFRESERGPFVRTLPDGTRVVGRYFTAGGVPAVPFTIDAGGQRWGLGTE